MRRADDLSVELRPVLANGKGVIGIAADFKISVQPRLFKSLETIETPVCAVEPICCEP